MLGGLADWRSRTPELWPWRQGDFQATNGCIFSMCQPYSSMLLNAASSLAVTLRFRMRIRRGRG